MEMKCNPLILWRTGLSICTTSFNIHELCHYPHRVHFFLMTAVIVWWGRILCRVENLGHHIFLEKLLYFPRSLWENNWNATANILEATNNQFSVILHFLKIRNVYWTQDPDSVDDEVCFLVGHKALYSVRGSSMFRRNILPQSSGSKIKSIMQITRIRWLAGLFFDPDDGDSKFPWNVGTLIPYFTASPPKYISGLLLPPYS